MRNLNLFFNKSLYNHISFDQNGLKLNQSDLDATLTDCFLGKNETNYLSLSALNVQSFLLKTTYPGLLAGTGYAHGISDETDFKVGFSFDYVTGQPYVPGSSVKGILRAAFDNPEVLAAITGIHDESVLRALTVDMFGSQDGDGVDVFFDMVLKCGNAEGNVLGTDYITPHPDPLKNPIPIKILKVLPDVIFECRFLLRDSNIDGQVFTADQKLGWFKTILCLFGVGAKTNVGYGNLVEASDADVNYAPAQSKPVGQPAPVRPASTWQNAFRSVGEIDRKKCPFCGKMNFRYKKDTKIEKWAWQQQICSDCKKPLNR